MSRKIQLLLQMCVSLWKIFGKKKFAAPVKHKTLMISQHYGAKCPEFRVK